MPSLAGCYCLMATRRPLLRVHPQIAPNQELPKAQLNCASSIGGRCYKNVKIYPSLKPDGQTADYLAITPCRVTFIELDHHLD